MKNEIVKYHNDLNTVTMRKWTAQEMDFFFAIIAKVRDKGTQKIEFKTDEIQSVINFDKRNPKRWIETMINTADKIAQLTYLERTTEKISVMTLFSRFDIYPNEKKIIVQISENFDYVVNCISVGFTTYELSEFTRIRSTYAKTMYRLLKQWRTIGKKRFNIDDYKRLMDMPECYSPSEIDRNVLSPIKKELPEFFSNLKVKKVKANTRGTPVIAYEFTWTPEKSEKWIDGKYDKKPIGSGKTIRKEKLPEWAKDDYIQPEDVLLPKEKQDEFNERLARIHAKKEDN